MLTAIRNSWALLFGMFLLQIGNGLQGTVLGVRGEAEGFAASTLGWVMSAYFVGFLFGTQITPWLLRRVGHVRVFAALASLVSAAYILYASLVDPVAWTVFRLIVGLCFSGVYVVAESWLNDGATNETRGQTISAYLTVQMLGIVLAQALLNAADPLGYDLFVLMSVLVSISFAPILLSSSPVPLFETSRRMTLGQLFEASPLGCVGMFLLGTVFACLFSMASVYAATVQMSRVEISIFIGTIYVGGMLAQVPIGWFSDRMDRRVLIAGVSLVCAGAAFAATMVDDFWLIVAAGFVIGGTANPLYSLLVAYVNDYIAHEDMASASGGLILINGVGAMGAPVLVGYVMEQAGANGFFMFIGFAMLITGIYGLWRMTQRPATPVDETGPMVPMSPVASPVVSDAAWDNVVELTQEDAPREA